MKFYRSVMFLLFGGLMLTSLMGCATSATKVIDLRCEDKQSPLGIDIPKPLLSWRIESAKRATMQSGYRVLVASDPAILAQNQADLWDSGEVGSDQSVNLEYAGKTLNSGQVAYWKV